MFSITIDDIFEGAAHEHVVGEWDMVIAGYTFLALCALGLGAIAQTCYWAAKAAGTNLDTELARVFERTETREALRGQLANLIVAGQSLSWGSPVEFIAESDMKTPDWSVGTAEDKLWVECTCSGRQADEFNNKTVIRIALAKAWNEKKGKFGGVHSPGLISCDISGIFCSREYGTILRRELVRPFPLDLPGGSQRTVGVYNSRADVELLAQESYNRSLIGVLASALRSKDATDRGIRGFLAYQGQTIWVNTITGQLFRPQRSILAWAGELHDPCFVQAVRVSQPAIPDVDVNRQIPPCHVYLV